MALIKKVNSNEPVFGKNCFLAENCSVIGDVIMGHDCSVWFSAVIRGDVNSIRIGNKVNIQDGAVIHCTYQKTSTSIGNNVTIGHRAIIHGCTIEDNVMIGMGAIILDGCVIKTNSIIASGAVVLENTIVEEGCIYAGVPAKEIKKLSVEEIRELITRVAENYVVYAGWYK